jgi:hypothetical protein
MWQRFATAAAVAAVGLAVGLPAAGATGTSVVSAIGCSLAGGQVSRPAGTEIVVRQGWAASTRGLVVDFLHAQTSSVSVNGGAPVDVSDEYTEPNGSNAEGWRSDVFYPTGVTLAAGQSMTFRFLASVSHPVFDGLTVGGPGTVADYACTVTGV